jgi:hypothetical protein
MPEHRTLQDWRERWQQALRNAVAKGDTEVGCDSWRQGFRDGCTHVEIEFDKLRADAATKNGVEAAERRVLDACLAEVRAIDAKRALPLQPGLITAMYDTQRERVTAVRALQRLLRDRGGEAPKDSAQIS